MEKYRRKKKMEYGMKEIINRYLHIYLFGGMVRIILRMDGMER